MRPMTIAEKILSKKSGQKVFAGDFCEADIDIAMTNEMLADMIDLFLDIGIQKVWNPENIVIFLDHYAPAPTAEAAGMHRKMKAFAESFGLKNFYGINDGVSHQVMIEDGWVLPGTLMLGTDSHATSYGALGAAAAGIGATEMISVFESGRLWFRVPETIRFEIKGNLNDLVTSKDVMLEIAGRHGIDIAQYKSCEFSGPCVSEMTPSSRITLCNMAVELGAKFSFVSPDEKVKEFLRGKARKEYVVVESDLKADYEKTFLLEANTIEPKVAGPPNISNVRNARDLDVKIDQAFLGSCTNGRFEDMQCAARMLEGRHVAKNVRMIVTPASRRVYEECLKKGLIDIFLKAGAVFTSPGCGACWGGHLGLLAKGEKAISSSNRNFTGRMGHPDSEIYIASPATVAASAIEGCIKDPREVR